MLRFSILNQDLNFVNQKWIENGTIYKPQGNSICTLYCFPRKRIIGQLLTISIYSLHVHIILRNTNRLLYLSMSPLNINHCLNTDH
jgi:hypothetical protein